VTSIFDMLRAWIADLVAGWNRFWFSPADPATLGLIRIFAGAMLFYTHLVWSLDLGAFFGVNSSLPTATIAALPIVLMRATRPAPAAPAVASQRFHTPQPLHRRP